MSEPDLNWVPLAQVDDVPPGKAVLAPHGKLEILIFHTPEGYTAFDNTCPHAGAPIYAEHFDGECVTCIYHGLRFRASDGGCPEAAGWELERYPTRVTEGRVEVGFRE
jgi:nitrite reductase/ring-hydroxylating ferredoxin subunit